MTHTVPNLPYEYNALEPHIDEETMRIHHDKHHQAYVDKLNAALETHPDLQEKPIEELLAGLKNLPENVQTAVRNHGGGHANHSMFWKMMSPSGGGEPTGKAKALIEEKWGSFDKFKEEFSNAGITLFGSGWVWLVLDGDKPAITTTPNQDTPISQGKMPLLGLDTWEHSFYVTYRNRKADYIKAWWNIVNWDYVNEKFAEYTDGSS